MDGVTQDQMRARLFPFSLLGKTLQWFCSQPAETVQNWNALMRSSFGNLWCRTARLYSLKRSNASEIVSVGYWAKVAILLMQAHPFRIWFRFVYNWRTSWTSKLRSTRTPSPSSRP
jgi:hypothetical protein